MKKTILLLTFVLLSKNSFSQVGIGTTNPDASSSLDISSVNTGLLVPRVSLTDVSDGTSPINSPANSLLVYNTNSALVGGNGEGYYYWNGTQWTKLQTNVDDKWTRNSSLGSIFPSTLTDKVGIGTNNPFADLHLKSLSSNPAIFDGGSNLYISFAENGAYRGYFGSYSGNPEDIEFGTYSGNLGAVHLSTNNTPKLTVINNGNIGIGNTNPSYLLDVSNRMRLRSGGNIFSSAGLWLNNLLNTTETTFIGMDSNDNIGFYGNTGAGWGLVMNNSNGNVGIGNQNPNAPLQFSNSVVNRKIVLYDINNNNNQYYGFGINGGMLRYQTDAIGADHTFFAGANATTSNELMRIKGTGNVGIGVSNPLQRLDVQGGNARINTIFIGDVGHGSSWAGMSHYNQANTNGYGFLQSIDGNYTFLNKLNTGTGYIGFRVGNFDQVVITNAGNMGIGTTNPTQKLDISGKIKITDGTQGSGKVLVSDANGTGTWTTTNSIKPAVAGVFAGGGGNPNSTTFVYCNTYIDLPPGKWMVFGTYLLAGSTTLPSGQSVFVRTNFQLSDTVTGANPYVISGGLISGVLAGPSDFGIANGQTIIENPNPPGGASIRFYMWAGIQKYGPISASFSMSGIGSSFWSENQLTAVPMN